MELQKILLPNVSTEQLQRFLGISMSVTKSETLNFTIDSQKLAGVANNEADSIYKSWSVNIKDICDPASAMIPSLKCSIYKGEEFAKRILSYFGQTVNINVFYQGSSVHKLELYKTDEKGRVMLKITVVSAPVETAFVEHSAEKLSSIFNPDEDNLLVSFTLDNDELSTVSKLSKLSTNPEKQTDYVKLYTTDGAIMATDNAFDVVLHESDVVLNDDIEIDKSLWSLIDKDKYVASVYDIDGNKILLCQSSTRDVKITLVLLAKIADDDIDFEDFDKL